MDAEYPPHLRYEPAYVTSNACEVRLNFGIKTKSPKQLKEFNLTGSIIERLDPIEIATLWASFLVRYDDNQMDRFLKFRNRICCVLEAEDIDGSILLDHKVRSTTAVAQRIAHGLKEDGYGDVSFGVEAKLEQFLNSIALRNI